jgi:hypothetical protein
MPIEHTRDWCHACQQYTRFERRAPAHLVHGVVSLCLCWTWIPIWILASLSGSNRWRCTTCGALAPKPSASGLKMTGGQALAAIAGIVLTLALFRWLLR